MKMATAITTTTASAYPATATPCAMPCHALPTPYPSSDIADTQTAVPIRLRTPNSSGGTPIKPATIDTNARTTGSARPTGIAQAPRPAAKRSARSRSARVINRYRPNLWTSGRPPARPAAYAASEPASSASAVMGLISW
jgi:hypothetical protein